MPKKSTKSSTLSSLMLNSLLNNLICSQEMKAKKYKGALRINNAIDFVLYVEQL